MNAIKGVLVGLASAGLFLTGAQAIAAPAPAPASAEASASVTGKIVAKVGKKVLKVKSSAGATVNVNITPKTVISGKLEVGAVVQVNGKKVGKSIVAEGIVVIKK